MDTFEKVNNKNSDEFLNWQLPNETERYASIMVRKYFRNNSSFFYYSFPWATYIDKVDKGFDVDFKFHNYHDGDNSIRITVCQHINALKYIEVFKSCGITDLFWCHATKGLFESNGIRIHPFPLFPVRYKSHGSRTSLKEAYKRKLLFNFQGAYAQGLYISRSREWIYSLPESNDYVVDKRHEWHFEEDIYRNQIFNLNPNLRNKSILERQAKEYVKNLEISTFTLCPSGSGPNSIRLWEALSFGSIPVLISDNLKLPGNQKLWEESIFFVKDKETNVKNLVSLLREYKSNAYLLRKKIISMNKLVSRYGIENFIYDIKEFISNKDLYILNLTKERIKYYHNSNFKNYLVFKIIEAKDPFNVVSQVTNWLNNSQNNEYLIIQIKDDHRQDILELRWRTPLQLIKQILKGKNYGICCRNSYLEK